MVGLYGIISYISGRRNREIGIRLALGARCGNVVWLVLRQGMLLMGAGALLGILGGIASTDLIESYLFGVKPIGWYVIAAGVLVIMVAGSATALIPAFRASRVDPIATLRAE